ncbi:prenyltransferase/squalene oxidase repeat-containing protein [Micromonospora sp. NBC_01638]|uniref:prenyltransferase/squalene oxidase repeat-containing protein n=1 Tax=Micromonospora sp. NBC_01638 TaxID=2975982 RepID=UPI00386D7D68|nr:terpene cyclase/mutase family protein [Micromonospora sp. NBC_01638]
MSSRLSSGSRRRRLAAVPAAALIATVVAVAAGAAPAAATSTAAQIATAKTNGVAYLRTLQATDGSYASGGLSNEWAFSAFAPAGVAAVDVYPSGDTTKNARTVYRNQLSAASWPSTSPVVTDYERGVLNAYAAGIDPARVSPARNLIADTIAYWQTGSAGYYGPPANVNGTIFATLALAGAKTQTGAARVPQALLDLSVTRIRNNQHNDGGWTFTQAEGNPTQLAAASDIDMTGAAMAALCVAGVPNTDTDIVQAKNFLKGKLVNSSGAFTSMFGVNTDSNAWAVSGLNACGIPSQGTDFTTTAGKTPIDFLRAQQLTGGGFKYLTTNTTPSAYASIDAVRALAGAGYTAAPPTPVTAGAPTWVAASGFTAGTATRLAVIIDNSSGSIKPCAVTLTPTATTTTLGAVLDAAIGAAAPSGCVTALNPTSGTGTITSINGLANSGSSTWTVSRDGGTPVTATRGTTVTVGDTIYLRYGV